MRDDNAAKIVEQLDKCQPCTDDTLYLPVECVGEIIRLALSMRSRIDELESTREMEQIKPRRGRVTEDGLLLLNEDKD
ncbi:hypothetical protein VN12_19660 [Pirellula sp. SH-Sr6A]|nr:hypothetical protein [Pirellula sp. SH-Sr6A]AMV30886.1 hypothetical protein VN12_02140 [Pirellula sp. SH-Sr6A]AMV31308.1 hypothetical protein VN12_04270 [Pirellula sp. SH-Sr6A]AMV34352.1 hypothetical protein VN12_19660 [Pirellula sp. SH-Sr6A]